MTSTVTTEFRSEYEQELERWLRRRFLWYCGVLLGFSVLGIVLVLAFIVFISVVPSVLGMDGVSVSPGGPNVSIGIEQAEGATGELATTDPMDAGGSEQNGVTQEESAEAGAEPLPAFSVQDQAALLISLVVTAIGSLATVLLYLRAFLRAKRELMSRPEILSLTTRLIVLAGLIGFATNVVGIELAKLIATDGSAIGQQMQTQTQTIGLGGLASILIAHLAACAFLPWTPRESLRPFVPLMVANAVVAIVYSADDLRLLILTITLSPIVGLPGLLVAWFRYSRFRKSFHLKMLKGKYGEMKRELLDARRLHESLFPPQMDGDAVSMRYAYEPMREIGGDFLFAKRVGNTMHAVLIDVTGHGVGAALTVNRLHGELERQFGVVENPDPASVLSGLNAYLHFALASHSVYATAMCMRADADSGTLEYASAGHPPAFHRTADGRVHRLESTTLVLGVVHPDDFDAAPMSTDFMRGDAVIAYTDGATEAVTGSGKMIRVDGLERIAMKTAPRAVPSKVASRQGHAADEQWCEAVLKEVHRLRSGPTLDDTLIVELRRPV